jgi:DNA-binding IclR family transcriptional regulator
VKAEGRGINSVEVGGRLLTALANAGGAMMLRDLAVTAGIHPAQAHAYLASFRRVELVEQDPLTGRYRLGPFAMRLGMARIRSFPPLRMASDAAVSLSKELGMMVLVVVWEGHGPVVVQVQEGDESLNVNIHQGTCLSVTGSASGRVFAAFQPTDAVKARVTQEIGGETAYVRVAKDKRAFDAQLAAIRRAGHATTTDAPIPGMASISAPVRDSAGSVLLAMTIVGTSGALDTNPKGRHVEALKRVTGDLTRQLSRDTTDHDAVARAGARANTHGRRRASERA